MGYPNNYPEIREAVAKLCSGLRCPSQIIVRIDFVEVFDLILLATWMIKIFKNCFNWLFQRLNIVANLTAENITLRHQLVVLRRGGKRPILKDRDRLFWIFLSHIWSGWRNTIKIIQPGTAVRLSLGD